MIIIGIILFIFLILSIIEASLIPIPFSFFFALLLIFYARGPVVFYLFAGGLLEDFFYPLLLGSSSLFYIIMFSVWYTVEKKIQPSHFLYRGIFFVIMYMLRTILIYQTLIIDHLIRNGIAGLCILYIASRILRDSKQSGKLTVV